MLKRIVVLIFMIPWMMGATGCPNYFKSLGDPGSDSALLYEAKMDADARNWSAGITAIGKMTAAGKAARGTKTTLASLQAGKCGLDLVALASSLTTDLGNGKTLWTALMSAMSATSVSPADCRAAEQTMLTISTTLSDLTPDENVFLAFVEFAKMGGILAGSGADADNNGSVDGGFNSCTNDSANIPDADSTAFIDVQNLGTGITIAYNALGSAGSSIGSAATATIGSLCNSIGGGFCAVYDGTTFSASQLKVIRALIKSNEIGFNTCGGSVGSSGACTCP